MHDELNELLKAVQNIPGDEGWWTLAACDTYTDIAVELWEVGVTPWIILDALTRAYRAAADELGD